jgi:hypothetical protein
MTSNSRMVHSEARLARSLESTTYNIYMFHSKARHTIFVCFTRKHDSLVHSNCRCNRCNRCNRAIATMMQSTRSLHPTSLHPPGNKTKPTACTPSCRAETTETKLQLVKQKQTNCNTSSRDSCKTKQTPPCIYLVLNDVGSKTDTTVHLSSPE